MSEDLTTLGALNGPQAVQRKWDYCASIIAIVAVDQKRIGEALNLDFLGGTYENELYVLHYCGAVFWVIGHLLKFLIRPSTYRVSLQAIRSFLCKYP